MLQEAKLGIDDIAPARQYLDCDMKQYSPGQSDISVVPWPITLEPYESWTCRLQVRNFGPKDRSPLKPRSRGPQHTLDFQRMPLAIIKACIHSRSAHGCKCSSQCGRDPCRIRMGCRDSGIGGPLCMSRCQTGDDGNRCQCYRPRRDGLGSL